MAICRRAKAVHGNNFTYTLIESNDIVWNLEIIGKLPENNGINSW
jgi:hypothetical protein